MHYYVTITTGHNSYYYYTESSSCHYNCSLITARLNNSIIETSLVVALVEDSNTLIHSRTFLPFKQDMPLDVEAYINLSAAFLNASRTERSIALISHQKIKEVIGSIKHESFRLRTLNDLLKLTIQEIDRDYSLAATLTTEYLDKIMV